MDVQVFLMQRSFIWIAGQMVQQLLVALVSCSAFQIAVSLVANAWKVTMGLSSLITGLTL